VTQHESVPVGVRDGDTPSIPVGVARGDHDAAGTNEAVNDRGVDRATDVEDEQILVCWCCRRFAVGVPDQLQMPSRTGLSNHQQRMAALGVWVGAV